MIYKESMKFYKANTIHKLMVQEPREKPNLKIFLLQRLKYQCLRQILKLQQKYTSSTQRKEFNGCWFCGHGKRSQVFQNTQFSEVPHQVVPNFTTHKSIRSEQKHQQCLNKIFLLLYFGDMSMMQQKYIHGRKRFSTPLNLKDQGDLWEI